ARGGAAAALALPRGEAGLGVGAASGAVRARALAGHVRAADADALFSGAGVRLDVRAYAVDPRRYDLSRRLQLAHGPARGQLIVVTRPATRPAAFFDMDRTLLRCNTGTLWILWLRRHGEISLYGMMRALSWIAQYKLSVLDMEAVAARVIADMAGQEEREL